MKLRKGIIRSETITWINVQRENRALLNKLCDIGYSCVPWLVTETCNAVMHMTLIPVFWH